MRLALLIIVISFLPFACKTAEKVQTQLTLSDLPQEIKVPIVAALSNAHSLQMAIKSVRALAVTNSEFNHIINDRVVTQYLLEGLVKKFPALENNLLYAALSLGTKGAREWVHEKNPHWITVVQDNALQILKNPELLAALLGNKQVADFITKELKVENEPALSYAVKSNLDDAVKILLKAGASVNVEKGWGPLLLAVRNNRPEIVRLLLAFGGNINYTYVGNSALMLAATLGHTDIITILLAANPNLNMQNIIGATALIFAASKGNFEIVKQLLEAGADPTIKNEQGKTALDIARERDFKNIADILQQFWPPQMALPDIQKSPL